MIRSLLSIVLRIGRETILRSGELTVWKACRAANGLNVIVELKVPAEARRITPFDKKFLFKSRVNHAIVQRIFDQKGLEYKEAKSFVHKGNQLTYHLGQEVRPDGFDDNLMKDCGQGISVHLYQDHCLQWFN